MLISPRCIHSLSSPHTLSRCLMYSSLYLIIFLRCIFERMGSLGVCLDYLNNVGPPKKNKKTRKIKGQVHEVVIERHSLLSKLGNKR